MPAQAKLEEAETPVPVTFKLEAEPVLILVGLAVATRFVIAVQGVAGVITVKLVVALAVQTPVPFELVTVTV